jgi:hypothetical protein
VSSCHRLVPPGRDLDEATVRSPHLSADEVGDRHRHRPDPKEKTRWHLIRLPLRDPALTGERAGPLVGLSADLRRANPARPVELWCEARLGVKAVARRVWAATGIRPTSWGRTRFESLYV